MRRLSTRQFRRLSIGFSILFLALAPLLFYLTSSPVQAQCGSSVSSCKNCHEVQGQDAVNTKGAWHTDHAFGDFCEFCHGGNVQAKSKNDAHQAMVDPLSDIKASCQSCHPNDYADKAQIYATTLGVTLGTGGGTGAGSPVTSTVTVSGTSAGSPVTGTVNGSGQGGPVVQGANLDLSQVTAPGAIIVDYNALYNGGAEPSAAQPLNWGNLIFIVVDLLLLLLFIGIVVYREHLVERFRQLRQMRFEPGMSMSAALAGGGQTDVAAYPAAASLSPDLTRQNPALARLLPRLARASPVMLAALDQLLNNEQVAEEVLVALTNVDLHLVDEFRSLNQRDRDLLIALARNDD